MRILPNDNRVRTHTERNISQTTLIIAYLIMNLNLITTIQYSWYTKHFRQHIKSKITLLKNNNLVF